MAAGRFVCHSVTSHNRPAARAGVCLYSSVAAPCSVHFHLCSQTEIPALSQRASESKLCRQVSRSPEFHDGFTAVSPRFPDGFGFQRGAILHEDALDSNPVFDSLAGFVLFSSPV